MGSVPRGPDEIGAAGVRPIACSRRDLRSLRIMSEQPLLPMHVAARMIIERMDEAPPEAVRSPEMLDGVANLLCVFTTVYERIDGRPLLREEVTGGAFRKGAREMIFPDGRPGMADLAVEREAMAGLVKRFKRLGILPLAPKRK